MTNLTESSSKIPADFTMEAMNGKTVDRTLKITRMMEEPEQTMIVVDVEKIITTDLEKKTDVPREMDGNPPEKGTETAVTVGPGTMITIPAPKKNTIASTVAIIAKKAKKRRRLVQKF